MAVSPVFEIQEILENILKYCDGSTLINAEGVCSRWKYIISCLNKKYDIWRLCCEREIPEDDLYDLLNQLYPRHYMPGGELLVCWQKVYTAWNQWFDMLNWIYLVRKIPIDFGGTNFNICLCIKSSGPWLLIGTKYSLVFYNIKNFILTQICTMNPVLCIQPYTIMFEEEVKMMKDLKHDAILLNVRETPVLSTEWKLNLFNGKLSVVDPVRSKGIIYKNILLQLFQFTDPQGRTPVCYVYRDLVNKIFEGPFNIGEMLLGDYFVQFINFYKNKVCFMMNSKNKDSILLTEAIHEEYVIIVDELERNEEERDEEERYEEERYEEERYEEERYEEEGDEEVHIQVEDIEVGQNEVEQNPVENDEVENNENDLILVDFPSKPMIIREGFLLYNWHCKVTLSVNAEGAELCVGNYKKDFRYMEDFSNRITAALFYLNMFFLGTDLGNVLMFRVPKLEDLLKIDLKKPTWMVKVCRIPITGFEIMLTDSKPKIVCNAESEIYMIEFLTT